MLTINGKILFNQNGITVHECDNCYIVSNGKETQVFTFMPLLNEKSLSRIFKTSDDFERFQLARYKNVMPNHEKWFEKFNNWLNGVAEQSEMHTLGY